ncbi:hypothetical protein [Enterococcus sp. AZ012]|uniref:hypothetical protein n=1 Tax=unclassified Enterococcus TaxID=2608891 RepID=UPI003D26B1B7
MEKDSKQEPNPTTWWKILRVSFLFLLSVTITALFFGHAGVLGLLFALLVVSHIRNR